jgi:dTDP-4-dehydrorhamnose 3,5-epimerase-like enzyme
LAIDWTIPADRALISDKDKVLPRLKELNSPFDFVAQ